MNPGAQGPADAWYRELVVEFPDGTKEWLHIERKPTGTHIPLLRGKPAPWTDLEFQKCPSCPLPKNLVPTCPAALSMQTTLGKLREHTSIEEVKATAVDARGRTQTVEGPLQNVGATLVQLAVFVSGCPVGKEFKPYLEDLPPFVSSQQLSRHIVTKILAKHDGVWESARAELVGTLNALHEIFVHLMKRLLNGGEPPAQDAIPNSIAHLDAVAQTLSVRADALFQQMTVELGWHKKPAVEDKPAGLGGRLASFFGRLKP
ncbi:MAG: hypothetical protein HY554_15975 [Elusimicrobia bacterium]|nr:hypothetical protein [Elusimicrobiota bacterium]